MTKENVNANKPPLHPSPAWKKNDGAGTASALIHTTSGPDIWWNVLLMHEGWSHAKQAMKIRAGDDLSSRVSSQGRDSLPGSPQHSSRAWLARMACCRSFKEQ